MGGPDVEPEPLDPSAGSISAALLPVIGIPFQLIAGAVGEFGRQQTIDVAASGAERVDAGVLSRERIVIGELVQEIEVTATLVRTRSIVSRPC